MNPTSARLECSNNFSIITWDTRKKSAKARVGAHPKTGLYRAVCDYLAGMTDRYVGLEYKRIFGKT